MQRFQKRAIAAGVFGAAFLLIMFLMYFMPREFSSFDTHATALAAPFQTLPYIEFFVAITTIGSTTGIIVVALCVAFLLRRNRTVLLRLALALAGSSVTVQVVKAFIGRVRPAALPWLGEIHSFSFPSGHATSSIVLYGFIGALVYTHTKSPIVKIAAILFPALLVLLIGVSRIVLAAHFFSDVMAGFVLGAFWLFLTFSVFKRARI